MGEEGEKKGCTAIIVILIVVVLTLTLGPAFLLAAGAIGFLAYLSLKK